MHFSDYDDRANELKQVFDAYYEGVKKMLICLKRLMNLKRNYRKKRGSVRLMSKNGNQGIRLYRTKSKTAN